MPKYTIELIRHDDTILARSESRNLAPMNRTELREWAEEAVQKFSAVWSVSAKTDARPARSIRVLCDGRELLHLDMPNSA